MPAFSGFQELLRPRLAALFDVFIEKPSLEARSPRRVGCGGRPGLGPHAPLRHAGQGPHGGGGCAGASRPRAAGWASGCPGWA